MYERVKDKRAEGIFCLRRSQTLRVFYYACYFSELSGWWNLGNPETQFIPLPIAFYFVTENYIFNNIKILCINVRKHAYYILFSKCKFVPTLN
jgi:hypothetical protein